MMSKSVKVAMTKTSSGQFELVGSSKILIGLIITYHMISTVTSASVVSKCCLPGQVFSVSHNFTCAYASESRRELYPLSRALHENFSCIDSANLTITSLDDINDKVIRAPDACLDFLFDGENIPVIFQCNPNYDESEDATAHATDLATLPVPRLANLRICCKANQVYDVEKKACVGKINDDNLPKFFSFLDEFLDFVTVDRGFPRCEHAIVDHVVNVTKDLKHVRTDGSLEFVVSSINGSVTLVANERNSCLDPGNKTPELITLRMCREPAYCQANTCLSKCCPDGQAFIDFNCSKIPPYEEVNFHNVLLNASLERGLSESVEFFNTSDYGLLIGRPCKNSMYVVTSDEIWHINPQGLLYVKDYRYYHHKEFCIDVFYTGSKGTFNPFVCFETPSESKDSAIRFGVHAVLEIISCTFLIITLLVYLCLPVLQNLHGKTLMCHVASLIVAYGSLAAVALNVSEDSIQADDNAKFVCKFLGYTVLLSWMAAFSWLNVMCFDIWWTFGGLGGAAASGGRSRAYKKRFIMYSLYAWGVPLMITSIGVAVDVTEAAPLSLRPNVGTDTCWFESGAYFYGAIIYFIIPVSLQLIANVVFFVLTALHCTRVKAEISRVMSIPADPRNRRFRSDRSKLIMNVKLFIVMGVTWTLELISTVVNTYATDLPWRYEFFYAGDIFNCLQGVLIFMLFVLKSKVYYALRRRLTGQKGKGPASNGGTGLQDPYKVRKSASSSTIMSTFAVSASP